MPPGRGKGRGTRTTVTRGSGSTQGSRPGPIEGISWNDLHQVYKAREPSGLFPEIELPHPRRPTENELSAVVVMAEHKNLLKLTPYHLSRPASKPAVQRYSDCIKSVRETRTLKEINADLGFFPEELHSVYDNTKTSTILTDTTQRSEINVGAQLDQFLKDETEEGGRERADAQVVEPDLEISAEAEAEDEYEEETDYVMSYFDNGEDEFYDELEDADGGEAYYD
ncbi:2545_t:CDS:2 [Paraglomus brasilianum]|uniref:2545_t:CDS:1 n=1 Tax=Paraglomus brasilianum TaxID=144538 RepID=A0A9N9GD89_9GLOM|nr:2545_t:CDS:2 [Paraglomus brasilianum]